jgi:hypothetical protein
MPQTNDEPIRVWLWHQDGRPAGEYVPVPGEERPTRIILMRPTSVESYEQDPRNGDRYTQAP